MIEAVIFDMDGLLIDSEPFWRESHIQMLSSYGVSITEDDVRVMAGSRTDQVIRHWQEAFNLEYLSSDKLESEVETSVINKIKTVGKELPGVSQLISLIYSHNIPMAIASSSSPVVINAVVDKLSLRSYMQVVHSAKYERFGKPHPDVFLTTAKKLKVNASKCLVFEDSVNGILAAKAAQMKCIAVPEAVNISKLELNKADLVVSSLSEVDMKILQSI